MTKRIIAYTLLFLVSAICAAEYKANYNVFKMISFRTYYKRTSSTSTTKPKVPAKTPTVSVEKMTYDADNKLIYTDKYIDYRPMKDILEELELTGSSMTITDELEKPELEENPRYKND